MKRQFGRIGNLKETMDIPIRGYETTSKRHGDKSEYTKKCLSMLEQEQRKFPNYTVHLEVKGGVPFFSYRVRDSKNDELIKRINRTLQRVEKRLHGKK